MRELGFIFCLLVCCIPAGARESIGIPQVSIKVGGNPEPLEIRELNVSVEVNGWLAETIYELEVFNHTNRIQEGEFSMQLPEGATVSTWAIDIEGKMRPAVSVEKELALNAYETIKRRMIDPGIVERQEDNSYRTRIFPLPAEGTRRMRIGFISRLGENGRYALPLQHDTKIAKFRCEVLGTKHLPFFGNKRMNQWSWSEENVRLDGELVVQAELPGVDKPILRMDQADGKSRHFIVQGRLDPKKRSEIVKPDHFWKPLRLLWDASYSGRFRDHEKEMEELAKLWKWLGDAEVTLHVLGYGEGGQKVFQIRDGNADALEKFLRTITYDGALDLRGLEPFDGATLLVTDGGAVSPVLRPEERFIDHFHVLSFRQPDGIYQPIGGMWADLGADWLTQLQGNTHLVRVDGMSHWDSDVWMDGDRFIVTGKVPVADAAGVRIRTAGMRDIALDGDLPKPGGDSWNFVRRAWAQHHLEVWEKFGSAEIIRNFARDERLASDHTSLIVLERFEDHVTYRIPPPEPDQLVRYEEALRKKTSSESRRFQWAWNEKLKWHGTEFPWVDEALKEEMNLVAIWVKSSRIAFPPEKLNTAALKPYSEWLVKAQDTMRHGDTVESSEKFDTWRKEMDGSLQELNLLRAKGADPAKGKPVHVSVRGFVKNPDVYSSDAPIHLSEAIAQADGVNFYGDLSRTFLYRDARRFGYNLESGEYKDVPLRWGDMIVVENQPSNPYGDMDPFADAGPSVPSEQPPTFNEALPRRRSYDRGNGTLGGGYGSSRTTENRMEGKIRIAELPVSANGLTAEWRAGLDKEAVEFYQKMLLSEQGSQAVSFAMVVKIAGILFEKGHDKLGEQVLSNLLELYSNPVEGARSFAYWLDEYGFRERAGQVLTELGENVDDAGSRALVSHDLGRITGVPAHFAHVVSIWPETRNGENAPVMVALTDFFASNGANVSQLPAYKADAMNSDIRAVVTTAGGDLNPHMREPAIVNTVWDSGAYQKRSSRVYEFQVRRAWPGEYKLTSAAMNNAEPVTARVEWFQHWGTAKQTKKTRTMLIERVNSELGSVKFEWE